MIVIGVDVHRQSLTAVAVDEVGRAGAELTVDSSAELVAWSASLDAEGGRALAGEEAWADAFKNGRTMSLDEAARLAIEPTRPFQLSAR